MGDLDIEIDGVVLRSSTQLNNGDAPSAAVSSPSRVAAALNTVTICKNTIDIEQLLYTIVELLYRNSVAFLVSHHIVYLSYLLFGQ